MFFPSLLWSRLLTGLRLIRLIQNRLWRLEFWFLTSVASSIGKASGHPSAGSVVSSLGCRAFGQGWGGVVIFAVVSVAFGVSSSREGLVTESVLCGSCSSGDASLGAGKASLGDCSGNRGGFSVISLSLRVLEQSCSYSPPNWWQSSLTMTSQSPSSSTSKLRWGSCSLFIRTWGTSWGMESGWNEDRPAKNYRFAQSLNTLKIKIISVYVLGMRATGRTLSEEPMTIKRSTSSLSCFMALWNISGRFSPKKTISGFMIAKGISGHREQWGTTWRMKMYIVIKVQYNKNTLNMSYKATQLSRSRRHVVASQSLCSQAERLIYFKESKKILKLTLI